MKWAGKEYSCGAVFRTIQTTAGPGPFCNGIPLYDVTERTESELKYGVHLNVIYIYT